LRHLQKLYKNNENRHQPRSLQLFAKMKLGFKSEEIERGDNNTKLYMSSNIFTLEHDILHKDKYYMIFKINTDEYCLNIENILNKFMNNAN
jgi:hypothetical protein